MDGTQIATWMAMVQDAVLRPLGWALIHFLWQGAVVALAVAGILWSLRRASAESRYAVACIGLALMLMLPVATAFLVASDLDRNVAGAPTGEAQAREVELAHLTAPRADSPIGAAATPLASLWSWDLESVLPGLLAVWICGVVFLTTIHVGGWRRVQELRRDTRSVSERWQATLARLIDRLEMNRGVGLRQSERIEVPMVVGWWRPVILVPVSAFAGLSPAQLEAILLHELAHVRRRDDVVNLMQTAVETLLFYHPGVWWLSGQIRAERENCCDDLAVRTCGDAVAYVRALANLEQLRPSPTPAFALGSDGGSLVKRVRRLVGRREPARHGRLEMVLAGMVAALVAFLGSCLLWTASPTWALPAPQDEPSVGQETYEEPPSDDDYRQEAIDELRLVVAETSYSSLTDDELALLVDEGLDDDDLRELEMAGYQNLRVDELTALARHDVDGDDVRELQAAGFGNLTVDELMMLSSEGVDGDDVRELGEAGFTNLTVDELLTFAREGVDGDDLRELGEAGFTNLTADEVLRLARAGVDGDDLRGLQSAGFVNLTLDELLVFAREGVDGGDLRSFAEAGFTNLSMDEVLALARAGVDGGDVRELQGSGFEELTLDELLRLAREGVDGGDIRELREAGLGDLDLDEVLRLAREGVDGGDVRELRAAGIENLTVEDLVVLAREGIDGGDVREMREAGHIDLTVERILELARYGDF